MATMSALSVAPGTPAHAPAKVAVPEVCSRRGAFGLATDGLANREIAAELVVSVRTVTTHLTHGFQKLQITGRAELPAELERG